MTKNLAVFALTMLIIGSVATKLTAPAFADWLIDSKGNLTHVTNVLGDQVGSAPTETPEPVQTPEPKQTAEPAQTTEPTEAQKQAMERQSEAAKKAAELQNEMQKKVLEQKRETIKFMLEASKEGQLNVKENVLDRNGKTINQKDTNIPDNEKLTVDQPDGKPVQIDAIKDGGFEIGQEQFKAQTKLPITINANNELQVTKPDGTKQILTVLPDQVVAKLGQTSQPVSPSNVQLTTNSAGDPVYVVNHEINKKLLGLFNVQFGAQTTVSATDPNAVTTTPTSTSILTKLLEQLSF